LADWTSIFAGISAAATTLIAGGVGFAARQVKLTKEQVEHVKTQTRVNFEDDLTREYRAIIRDIPARAFSETTGAPTDEGLNAFFRYFDLSNEQLFLARQGRVGETTAADWKEGIVAHAKLPMFSAAWSTIAKGLPSDYWEELRKVLPPVEGESNRSPH
jgi:hypothetical protein